MPLTGCSTYRAYQGPRRPIAETARLTVPTTERLIVDHTLVTKENVGQIEMLPGEHIIEWKFVYPNRYCEMKRLNVTLEAGREYNLGQKFFPAPFEGDPLEAVFSFAIEATVLPLMLLFPPETPNQAPLGDYYMWIVDRETDHIQSGMAPEVAPSLSAITFVPLDLP